MVKVGVVGCGHWGGNLIRNFSELGALSFVSDTDSTRASELAVKYHVEYLSFSELCAKVDLDAIIVATPAASHFSLAMEALKAGKHVFIEKPLATSQRDAEEMINYAENSNLHAMVGHLMLFHPAFLALKEIINNGTLGDLKYLRSTRRSFGQIRDVEDVLWSFAPHDISMIVSIMQSAPSKVQAHRLDLTGNNVADAAYLNLHFAGGVDATVEVSWLDTTKEQKLTVVGSKAMAVFDDTKPWTEKLTIYPQYADINQSQTHLVREAQYFIELPNSEPLRLECEYFIDLIKGKQVATAGGVKGLEVVEVLTQASEQVTSDHKNGKV